MITPQEIEAIADAVVQRLAQRADPPPLLLFRLNVRQFACAVQHSAEHIRRQCRARNIEAEGTPYLIHSEELAKFKVDVPLAVARLRAAGLHPDSGDLQKALPRQGLLLWRDSARDDHGA